MYNCLRPWQSEGMTPQSFCWALFQIARPLRGNHDSLAKCSTA